MIRTGFFCIALTLAWYACAKKPTVSPVLQVVAASPNPEQGRDWLGTEAQPIPLYLNSNVTVSFSQDVDPLSVTTDTVRILKVTPTGTQKVELAGHRVTRRAVILEPEWPLSPDLIDGSFQPDQLYRLEVAGYPLTNTVKSRSGVPIGDGFCRYYRTVPIGSDPGPLLPVGLPTDPFELTSRSLRIASDARVLRLHFTLPLHPASVSPRSFRFLQHTELAIESTRVRSVRRPIYDPAETPGGVQAMRWSYPSSTVELRLAENVELRSGEMFWVDLAPADDAEHWVRDYRGRHLTQSQLQVPGWISRGTRVELIRFQGSQPIEFIPAEADRLGFECRDGRIQVLARREAGTGRLGAFRPQQSMTLRPRVPFSTGQGGLQLAGSRFEFTNIEIPAGVTVTVQSAQPVELLANGHIRIDGELVLMTPLAAEHGAFESAGSETYLRRVLESEFGCRIVAAGDITVRGAIRHRGRSTPPPLVLLGRTLSFQGTLPAGTLLSQEPGRRVPQGTIESPVFFPHSMVPEFPVGERSTAAVWTPWARLPADFAGGSITAKAIGANGAIDVFVQVASPDPIDAERPYLDPAGLSQPRKLPLRSPISVSERVHVRFLLRAKVIGGKPLPFVKSLVVLGD